MALFLKRASLASVAAGFLILLYSAAGSGAAAQDKTLSSVQLQPSLSVFNEQDSSNALIPAPQAPASLADLVAAEPEAAASETSQDINCLAGAIYFEAGNEPLDGQLAVGRVIVNRTRSGRFPTSYCGVVYQPSQFSFIHGHHMPAIKTESRKWQNALAIAHIAHDNRWKSSAEGALFFHAARLGSRWQDKVRVAQIENHIFYR
ncbi:cell wall hydrolase [Novosphingobium sp. KACC 22771]|uniref:cell wall hydrolase n=1 Tax=Novosphingobium sp. KACC 22771 TaxID=3025670 RepID=UPI0023652DCC|nr:cell wall hydrolase [Novosphingobium sp. KACC 22771]WDF72714.1 cell wall hydrolase [Novosphingobium sp. KACC 22771]